MSGGQRVRIEPRGKPASIDPHEYWILYLLTDWRSSARASAFAGDEVPLRRTKAS